MGKQGSVRVAVRAIVGRSGRWSAGSGDPKTRRIITARRRFRLIGQGGGQHRLLEQRGENDGEALQGCGVTIDDPPQIAHVRIVSRVPDGTAGGPERRGVRVNHATGVMVRYRCRTPMNMAVRRLERRQEHTEHEHEMEGSSHESTTIHDRQGAASMLRRDVSTAALCGAAERGARISYPRRCGRRPADAPALEVVEP